MQIKERRLMTLGAAQPTAVAAIRNVVLLGPSGSGKTTLAERLIVLSGMALDPGSVADGTSILDADRLELEFDSLLRQQARDYRQEVEQTVFPLSFRWFWLAPFGWGWASPARSPDPWPIWCRLRIGCRWEISPHVCRSTIIFRKFPYYPVHSTG